MELARAAVRDYRIKAAPEVVHLLGRENPKTKVWAYNGTVPGSEIRARQGDRLRVLVENKLGEETTVHWHGLRVPNPMDGVPHLTQKPIKPGKTFVYEFDLPDAGTYWYHPHQRGVEQVGRGLYGPLIIEERTPIDVDRDVTWVLDDWRLLSSAQISGDFGNFHDVSHAGRIGNIATVNGQPAGDFRVRAGERIRLRLINGANARIFGLTFHGHRPKIIAYDGQPVKPHHAPGMGDRVQFITITTAPNADTEVVMRAFGPTHGLKPDNWVFLTKTPDQPEDSTRALAASFRHKFKVVEGGTQIHGVVTHIIDRKGRWRANFHGLKFKPVNLVLFINSLTNDAPMPHHRGEETLWDKVKARMRNLF